MARALQRLSAMGRLWRHVLVPYDFSSHATMALRVAAGLARRERGRLLVLHAIPPFSRLIGVPPGNFPPAVASSELVGDQRRRLEARVARALGRRGRRAVVCRVVVADPFHAIVEAARGATAVVMGTLGQSGLAHLVIGSVAEKVVRHAPVPVLTVRAGARVARGRRAASSADRRAPVRRTGS
jgi:nucleotide-binding universal stress UspA family protein